MTFLSTSWMYSHEPVPSESVTVDVSAVATLDPSANLLTSTVYQATVAGTVKDASGKVERIFGTVNQLFLCHQPGYTPPGSAPAKPVLTLPGSTAATSSHCRTRTRFHQRRCRSWLWTRRSHRCRISTERYG